MKLTEESTGARVRALRAKTTLGDGPVALLVEPDEAGADVLTSVLRLLGFQVLRVRRGDEALHALSLGPVDLMLLDADLPDLPAEQLLEVARKLPNYANARLVVTSAIHAEQSAVISGLRKRGAEEFFSRPYPVARIRHKLRAMFPLEQETSTKEKLSVRDAEALALPAAVIIGGVKRPVRLVAGNPSRCLLKGQNLPLGGTVEVRLKHKMEEFGELVTFELVAVGRVLASTIVRGAPLCEVEVQLSRPPLEWDRMTEELPDL